MLPATTFPLFASANWHEPILSGVALTLAFAVLARLSRGVNTSGALAGACLAFAIYLGAGLGGFFTLVCLFVLTWVATRIGYERKRRRELSELSRGRSGAQVAANLAVPAGLSLASLFLHQPGILLIAMLAALAEVAADTVSSECGEVLSLHAYLITTFERVPPGTDGGVSFIGTICGATAALSIGLVATGFNLLPFSAVLTPTLAATAGMFFDSLLGATLERRGLLKNNSVNLLGTASAAGIALLLAWR